MNVLSPASYWRQNKRRILTGGFLAVAAMLICALWYSPAAGLAFGAAFALTGLIKVEPKHPTVRFSLNLIWAAVCILISCVLPTVMSASANYLSIGVFRLVMNYLCVAVVYGLCLAITGRIRSAVTLASFALLVLAVFNDFVLQFRGNLLKPTDILFVKTAMNVAGKYTFRIREGMGYSFLIWGWMLFAQGGLPRENWIPRKWIRLTAVVLTVGCAVVFWSKSGSVKMSTWGNDGIVYNGYYLNFAAGIRDFFVEPPEGYGEDAVAQLEEAYPAETAAEKRPNILVIMNESFADMNVLGDGLRTNMPVTPFVDSLKENTIRGYALTSIFGGTTANAEFEFLTGLSMANAPEGCPYEQFIRGDISGLVSLMNSRGYRTFATHPYLSSGWNRVNVYGHMGFSNMTFLEDYPRQDLMRGYVSDREMYDYVLNALAETEDQPLFLFGITMQNHGDYIYSGDDFTQTIFLEGYEEAYPMAEQYLSLLHESDKAVEYLLAELEKVEEDTVVLFFGDHLPQIEGSFLDDVHGGEFETLSQKQLLYTVPFFIWANYDLPEQEVACTSLNYLGRYLLEAAGMELPPFYQFLKELEKTIPAVNRRGFYSPDTGEWLELEDAQGEEALWLGHYRNLQYNSMFDRDGRSGHFFPLTSAMKG